MPALFDFLYQEYCRSRLAEMRKQLLLMAQLPEISDSSGAGEYADKDGLTADTKAGQHETRIH